VDDDNWKKKKRERLSDVEEGTNATHTDSHTGGCALKELHTTHYCPVVEIDCYYTTPTPTTLR
jgi:hypothetical protein